MRLQELDSQSAGAINSGPDLCAPQRAGQQKSANEPFAYFQFNEGWDMWEQVAHEHRYEDGVVAAYRSPPATSA